VLALLLLGKLFPVLPLFRTERPPLSRDTLGEIGLALPPLFPLGINDDSLLGYVGYGNGASAQPTHSVLAAFTAEENESILRSFDVIVISFLWSVVTGGGRGVAAAF
jgi:hypothetical protein